MGCQSSKVKKKGLSQRHQLFWLRHCYWETGIWNDTRIEKIIASLAVLKLEPIKPSNIRTHWGPHCRQIGPGWGTRKIPFTPIGTAERAPANVMIGIVCRMEQVSHWKVYQKHHPSVPSHPYSLPWARCCHRKIHGQEHRKDLFHLPV